uniref:Uncharacterized protein n=1 Tax=Romanomermis culicivorax TaxID=13658 RepID=A0A915LA83_ROMCU
MRWIFVFALRTIGHPVAQCRFVDADVVAVLPTTWAHDLVSLDVEYGGEKNGELFKLALILKVLLPPDDFSDTPLLSAIKSSFNKSLLNVDDFFLFIRRFR